MTDLRFASRTLLRNPSFTVAAILAIALGIGATTAIFSVVDAVLLRPLPYPDSDQLVSVSTHFPGQDFYFVPSWDYIDWARDNRAFDGYAAMGRIWEEPVPLAEGSLRVLTARVTTNMLDVLRVSPFMGRKFRAEDARPDVSGPLLISYALWQSHFASDKNILDKSLRFDGAQRRIAGVLPPNFIFPSNQRVDALEPIRIDYEAQKDRRTGAAWDTIGRRKPGVTLAQARANFDTLFASTRAAWPQTYRNDVRLVVQPFQDRLTGNVKTVLLILLGGVGCVLLIACANVANLLLARATARQREIATRAALGASRSRLIRQLLTESVLLSSIGAVLGMLLAAAAVRALRAGPVDFPRLAEVTVDLRILLFALFAALLTGMIFGLAPAFAATRPVTRFARSGPRGFLVAAEIALSLALLIGASLLFQSLWRMQHKNIGFAPDHVVTVNLPKAVALDEVRRKIASIPGVATVAFTDGGVHPYYGNGSSTFSREGRPLPEPWHRGDTMLVGHVSPGYHEALGIPLLRGRFFTDADSPSMAIVNETLVRTYFPGEDPIGKKIDLIQKMPKTIVGVVADVKNRGLTVAPLPEMETPLAPSQSAVNMIVRTLADPLQTASAIREGLRALDPQLLATVTTMNQQFDEITARPRFNGLLFGSFAAIALLLAMVGVYGVISFTVARRIHEIGIRMALGADATRVVRLILRDVLIPTSMGILVGLGAAIAASRSLASLLYDIKPTDPATYILASAVLAAVGLAAAFVPARRASHVDPMSVLKADC